MMMTHHITANSSEIPADDPLHVQQAATKFELMIHHNYSKQQPDSS
jgi:hypothetical protein